MDGQARAGWAQLLLGLFLLALGCALLYSLIAVWPAAQAAVAEPDDAAARSFTWFGGSFSPSAETAVLLLVVVAGALGSSIHALASFADHVGNRTFDPAWSWWYVLRVVIGAALAVIAYLAARALLVAGADLGDVMSPAGIAALAGLAGLCARQATDWLRGLVDLALASVDRFVLSRLRKLRDRL